MNTHFKDDTVQVKLQTTGIELYKGYEASALLSEESFLKNWAELYNSCVWATVFQSSAFVNTWYRTYETKFLPIVLLSKTANKLDGLLTLAMPLSNDHKAVIMGAGEYEAEYQAWLTPTNEDNTFIVSALQKLMHEFPQAHIHLRFLPSKIQLEWINSNYWKNKCVLQQHRRPLMDLHDPDLSKMFRKTEFRNKLNRLKRLGTVEFLHITDKAEFLNILNDVIVQFDFRQGAMFNFNQFMDEPLKSEFLIELFDKNLLHVSALKVNGQLYASIIAIVMHDWVHLGGINVHAPFNAKYCSPGFIHFRLLAEHLSKSGFSIFDLTPGGDPYKERMATQHDFVHELVITNNRPYIIKRKIRRLYYKKLEKRGKWPMGVELSVRKQVYLLKSKIQKIKNAGIGESFKKAFYASPFMEAKETFIYKKSLLKNDNAITINKNSLPDLLCFESEGTWMTRWEFLEDAMYRFEVGQNCFTYCENNRLLCCVWHNPTPKKAIKNNAEINLLKGEFSLLSGFYMHPKGEKLLKHFLNAVLNETIETHNEKALLASFNKNDNFLKQVLLSNNFQKITLNEIEKKDQHVVQADSLNT